MEGNANETEKLRYSDAELAEFEALILEKLETARKDLELLNENVAGGKTVPMTALRLSRFWKKVLPCCQRKRTVNLQCVNTNIYRTLKTH